MRTNQQQKTEQQDFNMLTQIKTIVSRQDTKLLEDALGAIALMTMLVGSLYLPGLL